jgi:hypothetical protein
VVSQPPPWSPGDPPPTPEQLDAIVERTRAAFAWRASLDDLEGTADVGGVRVAVGSSGALRTLRVADSVCADGGEQAAARVLAAVAAAQQDLAVQIRRSSMETFGEGSGDDERVAASLAQRFPATARVLPPDDGYQVRW